MTLRLEWSAYFAADVERRVDWYREQAGPEIAEQFVACVRSTLTALCRTPGLGRPRFLDWPELGSMRSFRVERPFHRHLIFYRFDGSRLLAERLIHGARDLPRRLTESPFEE
ncbi:MAG: type II toxin-antitoxin system RelE/ParE family toxin [Verrucomicrobiales bacterium]|nr:type II toxin-antitoxin system RelE/ParE family toxin [Verrucomicrobiales bacterium]